MIQENEDEKATFAVKFEVKDTIVYRVEAYSDDEAIKIAQDMADLDYNGDAEFYDVWED